MASYVLVIDDVKLNELLYSAAGPVSKSLRDYAQGALLAIAKNTLSRPFPGRGAGPFPPPGPPYERTGDLRNTLEVVDVPGGTSAGPETAIVTTAIHRGRNYGEILRARGYRFLPDEFYT